MSKKDHAGNKRKFLTVLIVCLFLSGCFKSQPTAELRPDAPETAAVENNGGIESNLNFPHADVPLPKAIDVSTRAEDVELSRRIDEIIEKSQFRNARWGVFVTSLKDGRVLTAREAQKTFVPASTQKLLTTAIALDKLGAGFRWKTSVMAQNPLGADGTLNGDLILYGRGAPDFDEPDMANLVNQLKQKGLRRIKGNVVGEAGFFRAANLGSGWVWEEAQWYYGAEPSALSYSDNTVLVEVVPAEKLDEPATVKTTPEAPFIKVSNSAMTTAAGSAQTFGVHRDLEANNFHVWGEVPRGKSMGVRTTMHEPQLWAASELKKSLEKNGIMVEGEVKSSDWKTSQIDPKTLTELAAVESDPLAEIVKRTNKHSINLNAELMLRTLGHQVREAQENQNGENGEKEKKRRSVLGDDQLGAMVIQNWLKAKGVELGDTVIQDGSGLSRLNFITPETMGRLLVFAMKMKDSGAFVDSLPIAGTDGTMGGRLAKYKGNVAAKTGTIAYVNALAGYAKTSEDETLAFVILCNNQTRNNNANSVIDSIASLVAGYPNFEKEKPGETPAP